MLSVRSVPAQCPLSSAHFRSVPLSPAQCRSVPLSYTQCRAVPPNRFPEGMSSPWVGHAFFANSCNLGGWGGGWEAPRARLPAQPLLNVRQRWVDGEMTHQSGELRPTRDGKGSSYAPDMDSPQHVCARELCAEATSGAPAQLSSANPGVP